MNDQNILKIRIDLNDGERRRFAKHFRQVSKLATEVVEALEKGDDDKLIKCYAVLQAIQVSDTELFEIILKAVGG